MMQWTTRSPVSGNEHSLPILNSPSLATCSMRTMISAPPVRVEPAVPLQMLTLTDVVYDEAPLLSVAS